MSDYRIERISARKYSQVLKRLHEATFAGEAPMPDFKVGEWWICSVGGRPVAFAGLQKSTVYPNTGYFSRVGVLKAHRGNHLQDRFMRAIEARARAHGWRAIVSDTTHNPPSANSFIRRGWKTFSPKVPWSYRVSIYWRIEL